MMQLLDHAKKEKINRFKTLIFCNYYKHRYFIRAFYSNKFVSCEPCLRRFKNN